MKPSENLFDYVERVKELRTAILDGKTTPFGFIDESIKESIEISARDSFVNGLPSDLLIRVKLEQYFTLEDAITTVIQLSKTLEAENLRRKAHFSRNNTPFRADVSYKPRMNDTNGINQNQQGNQTRNVPFTKPLFSGQSGPNSPVKPTCYYCKIPGHVMSECRKLAYRKAMQENQNFQEKSGNATSVPVINSARRDAIQQGRPVTKVTFLQDKDVPHTSRE